jgi:hypothetical protein
LTATLHKMEATTRSAEQLPLQLRNERVFNLAMFAWNEQNEQTLRLYFNRYDLQHIPLYDSIC